MDAQQPSCLNELDYHPDITHRLQRIAKTSGEGNVTSENGFPHLLFTGPIGAGKRTRVSALLRDLYQSNLTEQKRLRLEYKSVKINDSKTIEVTVLSSPYHIELNLSEVGSTNDRVVIMTLIREIAESTSISTKVIVGDQNEDSKDVAVRPSFRVLVLHQVELLSRGAQQALRRTMEKYVKSCRLILIASGGSGTGRIIAPIRSRCLEIRVPAPNDYEIEELLLRTLRTQGEAADKAAASLIPTILDQAGGDLRKALLLLESYWRNDKQAIEFPWKMALQNICQKIKKEQTPKQLSDLRTNVYDLLQSCVPGEIIIKEVCLHFCACMSVRKGSDDAISETVRAAAEYERNIHLGTRAVVHVEAFFATLMSILKKFNLELR